MTAFPSRFSMQYWMTAAVSENANLTFLFMPLLAENDFAILSSAHLTKKKAFLIGTFSYKLIFK